MTIEVRAAQADDLVYIDSLQRKNAETLSFYPRSALEREIGKHRIVLALVNNEPAGYLYHGAIAGGSPLRIHQACIQYDLRGSLYGAALVNWLKALAGIARCLSITLRCASDIEANGFWKKMGFQCVSITPGGVRRMRDINNWCLSLEPVLFPLPDLAPSTRVADASLWRRTSKGEMSQFIRGDQLRQYRAVLEKKGS